MKVLEIVFSTIWSKCSHFNNLKAFFFSLQQNYSHLVRSLLLAARGKSSMKCYFGCKLHLIMNQSGNMVSTVLLNGHTADIKIIEQLVVGLKAKLYADRGYIAQNLKQSLKAQPIELITYHRKNMPAVN